ncbi:hypothetical protein Y1Q_0011038 [Alligator mississippiensis]|uniref:Ig-like domain-containing protein n=1 Tax=Alligator mississippiensis TaxID=8496 RepID=A0A151MTE5_ALLMI|nr:hypothetical protein Y1Q_0011038 [Alligator mississippiensis]
MDLSVVVTPEGGIDQSWGKDIKLPLVPRHSSFLSACRAIRLSGAGDQSVGSSTEKGTSCHHHTFSVFLDSLLPKLSISTSQRGVIPLKGTVTIQCECQCWDVQFYLYKDRSEMSYLLSHIDGGKFIIHSARWEDGGSYHC